jgi:hypothetical protein
MSALVDISHGRPRPRPGRRDRQKPSPDVAALAAPHQDPKTGRWLAGNPGARLRQLKRLADVEAASLLALRSDDVAPWLRPHLSRAQDHVQSLVDGLGEMQRDDAELVSMCGDEGKARLMLNAALTEGARVGCSAAEARRWREEARAWLREVRQVVLTRKAVQREVAAHPPDAGKLPPWFEPEEGSRG